MDETDLIKTIRTAAAAPADPLALFAHWLADAEKAELRDPNAMAVSTCAADGTVRTRILLLKGLSADGFVFYTNQESLKGRALAENPVAALNFHWKALGRQICVEGRTEKVTAAEADAYFATRPRGSRIGAWASQQSRPLDERTTLEERVRRFEEKFEGQDAIPRPPYWGGYTLRPNAIEFWSEGAYRLHTRIAYRRAGDGWKKTMLFP